MLQNTCLSSLNCRIGLWIGDSKLTNLLRKSTGLDSREEHETRKPRFWGRSFGWQKGKGEMEKKKRRGEEEEEPVLSKSLSFAVHRTVRLVRVKYLKPLDFPLYFFLLGYFYQPIG